jgi:all-trans-8'-apo-beta-carotenal 15,15'-oxygenase
MSITTRHRGTLAPPTIREPSVSARATSAASGTLPQSWAMLDRALEDAGVRFESNGLRRTSVPVDAPWLGGVENAHEVFGVQAVTLEGALPPGLRGTVLRNGPGRFERDGERVPHWFDGDGGILRVALDGRTGEATVDYRFVRSKAYEAEEAAGRFNHPAFGYLPEGTPVRRSLFRVKNPANTNVVPFGDRLLALYEGAHPTALDKRTLETIGEVDLGALKASEAFTAHPHRDADGRNWAFSFDPGPGGGASLLELDDDGNVARKRAFPALKAAPHDFVDAGPFLIFIDPPVKTNPLPALLGLRAIGDEIGWRAHGKTKIHVVDKESLDLIVTGAAAPFSSAHFGGGRLEEDGTISFIAFVPEENDPSGQAMARFARGEHVQVGGTPTRIHVDPKSGDIVKQVELAQVRAEWPAEDPRAPGAGADELWCATQADDAGYFNGYARLNRASGLVDRVTLPAGTFGNEPALSVDEDDPSRLWLVTVQYASRADEGQLVVYDAHDLARGAIYRAALPGAVPFGFHGTLAPLGA